MRRWWCWVGALALLAGCGSAPSGEGPAGWSPTPATGSPAPSAPPVLFLGDSITAGQGLEETEAFPAVVAAELRGRGQQIAVINAGVSGDTTTGGLARIDWLLRHEPRVVVVALGANDGLRGLDLDMVERNLREIIIRCQAAGASVLLCGIELPPNYGADYTGRFRAIYPRLAKELGVVLVPFLLEGVGGVPDLNQPDGIHPNAAGQRRIAANVLPWLKRLLDEGVRSAPGGP